MMLMPDAATDAIVLGISPETAWLQENGLVHGHPTREGGPLARTRHVYTSCPAPDTENTIGGAKPLSSSFLDALLDDSEDEEIRCIRLNYIGSRQRYAEVEVQGDC